MPLVRRGTRGDLVTLLSALVILYLPPALLVAALLYFERHR